LERNEVEQKWIEIGSDQSGEDQPGFLTRRILAETGLDLRLGIQQPANRKCLLIEVDTASLTGVPRKLPECSGFEFQKHQGEHGKVIFLLKANEARHEELFAGVVADVLGRLSSASNEREGLQRLVNRLSHWQAFFRSGASLVLTAEQQRGLFGELWLFRQFLNSGAFTVHELRTWVGPLRANQDFQFPRCAVECKVTLGLQDQRLTVAHERQLDSTGTGRLFLVHQSLDMRVDSGETLPAIVNSIRAKIAELNLDHEVFEGLLIEAGFLEQHAPEYQHTGYTHRETNYFDVRDQFPRIVESDLRHGVGNVHYSITVSQCRQYAVSEQEMLAVIMEKND
jgi:hypothetical protein